MMQLEEGEIDDDSNDGIDPYTPLERPDLGSEAKHAPEEESDKESDGKRSINSDSDDDFLPSKPKMLRMIYPPKRPPRNKYSVWCKDSNEHLTDFLGTFGVTHRRNDRSVENYTLPFLNERKRKIPKRKAQYESAELEPIILEKLEETEISTFEALASDIAKKLSESNYDLVLRIVIICGKEKAIELYNRTCEIEQNGGLLIANKSRRRTSGGVFIFLVRYNKSITRDQKNEIFEEANEKGKRSKSDKKKQQRNRNYKDWLKKMNYEKEIESGQEELNNPPPSPESHCPQPLPELCLRRDILSYNDLNLQHSTDSEDGHYESIQNSELPAKVESMQLHSLPTEVDERSKSPSQPGMIVSPTKQSNLEFPREVVDYDDVYSMDLIYD